MPAFKRQIGGFAMRITLLLLFLPILACGLGWEARAAGPVETSVFAVQGVDVDVTDKDAAAAKDKALIDVQMKAIVMLAQKLGNAEMAAEIAKLSDKEVLPLLKSLSIEEESTSPGRYIGKFTVRFQPAKIEALFSRYGVKVSGQQAQPLLLLPVWKDQGGAWKLWSDNPWITAWRNLHLEQGEVPVIIPLGDTEDSTALTADDVVKNDPVKLEVLRRRYEVKTLLVATAEPAEGGGVHATMSGISALGKITFDKVYTADDGRLESSATLAAQRFHEVMIEKFRSDRAKAAAAAAQARVEEAGQGRGLPVSVPFTSPTEWNSLRARILAAPGVIGVDVATLSPSGAIINVHYAGPIEALQSSIMNTGLTLTQVQGVWTIQSM